MPHRISLEDRPASLLDRFENRLKRLYVPRATIPLIFALVMALALIVYLFSWGAYRSQQPVEPVVIAPGALGAAATSSMGERSFILEGRRWRQQSLEGSEGRPVATSSEEGRRIVEAEPQLEALLANGSSVLLFWQGEAVELRGTDPP